MPKDAGNVPSNGRAGGTAGTVAWCLYDWANSAFPTVIVTFVFAAYFTKQIAANEIAGTSQWSLTVSLSMLAAALTAPFLGAIADRGGRRKPWIAWFTLLLAGATATLWFAKPGEPQVWWVLLAFGFGNYAFETGTVFYNAMLPDVAPPGMTGRISGWGWGLGYAGGLVCLILCLFVLIRPDPPLFGLDPALAEPVRATALLTSLWLLVFSIPFFVASPDRPTSGLSAWKAARAGLSTLISTLRSLRHYREIALFLLAHMIYADGLNTLFSVGGIYAAVTFGMSFQEILLFGIALNITAGLGAFGFGWVDDWLGPKRTVLIAIGSLTVLGGAILLVDSKFLFWCFALPIGVFLGPAQAASRSLMARLAPPTLTTEMFGLYGFSGRATAFIGPALFGIVTDATGSQRLGLSTILVLFIAGAGLLVLVREPLRD